MAEDGNEEMAAESSKKSDDEDDNMFQSVMGIVAAAVSVLILVIFFPIMLPKSIKVIHEYERGLVVRLGRARKKEVINPGIAFILPFIDDLWIIDVRTKCCQTASQQVLTSDSVSIKIDAVLTADVEDPYKCLLIGQGHSGFVSGVAKRRVQNTLRTACGKLTLTEIINGKENLTKRIMRTIRRNWAKSVKITRVEIKDITLPGDMQRSMASEAISKRQAQAKIISADGEIRASHVLKNAAHIVSQSPAAIHLRYFQSLLTVSKKNCKTIVLPYPPQLIDKMKQGNRTFGSDKTAMSQKIIKVLPK